jgi:hypothetical protein
MSIFLVIAGHFMSVLYLTYSHQVEVKARMALFAIYLPDGGSRKKCGILPLKGFEVGEILFRCIVVG